MFFICAKGRCCRIISFREIAIQSLQCAFFRQACMRYRKSDNNFQKSFEKLTSCTTKRRFQFFDQMPGSMLKTLVKFAKNGRARARSRVVGEGAAAEEERIYSNRRARRARYLYLQQHFSASTAAISMIFFLILG